MRQDTSNEVRPDDEITETVIGGSAGAKSDSHWHRALIESAGDAIVGITADGVVVSWNDGAERLFGFTSAEVIGRPVALLIPPDRLDEESTVLKRICGGERIGLRETKRSSKDGRLIDVSLITSPVKADGRIIGASEVARDIGDRKLTEDYLRKQQTENLSILDSVPALIWFKDRSNRHLRCNQLAAEFMGLPVEAVEGTSAWDLFPAAQAERFHAEDLEVINSGAAKIGILEEVRTPAGELRWHQTDKLPYFDREGNIIGVVIFSLEVTERMRAEEALRESEDRYRDLVENSHELICTHDLDGRVLSANPWASRILGIELKSLVGMNVRDGLPPEHRADFEEYIRTIVRDGSAKGVMRVRTASGEERIWEYHNTLRTHGVETPIVRGMAHDITDRRQSLAREREARKEAEAANRLKDEFLATLSHELRTPLTAILGWSRMLNAGRLTEADQRRGLESIERNAHAQSQLIEDILDVSRTITGQLRLNVRPVALNSVVEAAVDSVLPAAEAKGIRLFVESDRDVLMVTGDPVRLQQVVWNLVANAIKFTPRGGEVRVALANAGDGICLTVSDTGYGISPAFLPYVFDRFRQADGTATRQHGGLGLGLAIVRHLVELHGGTVRAESGGQGQGAAFVIDLPAARPSSEGNTERANPPAEIKKNEDGGQARLDGLRVLIVENDDDTREYLNVALESLGASVRAASSAVEALTAFEDARPDILISDIGMPEVDGYDLIRRVRALPAEKGGAVPAIALTGYAEEADRERAMSAGYQRHAAKPVEPSALAVMMTHLVNRP